MFAPLILGARPVEGREGRPQTNVNVELSQEQRTRVHDVIVKGARRAAGCQCRLLARGRYACAALGTSRAREVGTRVPRSVHLVRVPSSIIEIEPNWRGFEYFLVGDEIIIVDPRTMEIVAVVLA
jgi:hypothetical protein